MQDKMKTKEYLLKLVSAAINEEPIPPAKKTTLFPFFG